MAGGAHVEHDHAHPSEIAFEAPLRRAALGVRGHGEIGQDPLAFGVGVRCPERLVDGVVLEFVGREVAEVLVDEVAGERPDHPVTPPGLRGHLATPRVRGVPVVAQVVVIEDHATGHRRQEPAHVRVAPRLVVQPRVLLEIADLAGGVPVPAGTLGVSHRPRSPTRAPAFGQSLGDLPAGDVRVHLIAEQQHGVGPLVVRGVRHPVRERHQRVGADRAQGPGGLALTTAAGAERQAHGVVVAGRADHAGPVGVQWPGGMSVELDLVRRFGAFAQLTQVQDGEVVPEHAPARLGDLLTAGPDRDPTRRGHLDPDRGLGGVDVPQQWADEDLGTRTHGTSVPRASGTAHGSG